MMKAWLVVLLLGCSCTRLAPTPAASSGNLCLANLASYGERVQVVRDRSVLSACRAIDYVSSPRCRGEGQGDFHLNGLRNAAGKLGADHLLLLPQSSSDREVKGQAFLCRIPLIAPAPALP